MKEYSDLVAVLEEADLYKDMKHGWMTPFSYEYLAKLIQAQKFPNILEIGRSTGHSFAVFSYFSPDSYVVSIDPYGPGEIHAGYKATADKVADLLGQNYKYINGTSFDIKEQGILFDLVLIDGDHTGLWPEKDWKNIQGLLSPDAIVIFDDYWMGPVRYAVDNITGYQKSYILHDGDKQACIIYTGTHILIV